MQKTTRYKLYHELKERFKLKYGAKIFFMIIKWRTFFCRGTSFFARFSRSFLIRMRYCVILTNRCLHFCRTNPGQNTWKPKTHFKVILALKNRPHGVVKWKAEWPKLPTMRSLFSSGKLKKGIHCFHPCLFVMINGKTQRITANIQSSLKKNKILHYLKIRWRS